MVRYLTNCQKWLGENMAKKNLIKAFVKSCDKATNPEDIAKGLLFKAVIIPLEEFNCKSKVELKAGTEVETVSESGYFKGENGISPWYKILEVLNRK
jgi:hypothetical protein